MKVKIEIIDGEACIILPRAFLEESRLNVGDEITLTMPHDRPQFSATTETSEEEFQEQLAAARLCLAKYKTALRALDD